MAACCPSCAHPTHLNADFFDQRLDILDLSYLIFLFLMPFLALYPYLPVLSLVSPLSFLLFTHVRRTTFHKPPEPPADMAIVRLADQRVYFRNGSWREFKNWGGSGVRESKRDWGRVCLGCDDKETVELDGKGEQSLANKLQEIFERFNDWRLPTSVE